MRYGRIRRDWEDIEQPAVTTTTIGPVVPAKRLLSPHYLRPHEPTRRMLDGTDQCRALAMPAWLSINDRRFGRLTASLENGNSSDELHHDSPDVALALRMNVKSFFEYRSHSQACKVTRLNLG
jgi:hypothetical protein